ncbi:phosphoribosylformylglycinamidine synthase subunit PurS [Mobilicoccus pelagius]|uniref:Phosphoribosylformylglycinamidine synthase n=1 Tax=Mobilicoccus pelagius NBRC 104925 TaxID=1089455 RepID=H5UUH5_9MICO|nr:phosphoribosylformylglycinamidine synthase subunit PurS [Mobilicoccus pelagius]GAB49383.1 phosphoribosylformylglycinamidine synthase [Mobilicoccus pelagius NBRC 104925]
MGSVVVDVMPKSTEQDPLGRAVTNEAASRGFSGIVHVRQGKRFVVAVEGDVTQQTLALVRQFAEKSLVTPEVDEIVSVREAGDATDLDDDVDTDWDDMPDYWGAGDAVPVEAGEHEPRPVPAHHEIDETMLGHVEAGSYYGRADDVRS